MEPYKMEVWSYEEGKRKVPTIIDTRTQMVVCQMQCDEGRDNPYTFPLSEAESRANEIVMLLNREATSLERNTFDTRRTPRLMRYSDNYAACISGKMA